jgi:hypothetical protein
MKDFNEQALHMAGIFGAAIVTYGFAGSDTIVGIIFGGICSALFLLLFLKIFYYILALTITVPVHMMVAYALIDDADLGFAIADLLHRRYGYKAETGLLVEDDIPELEAIEEDLRQVVVHNGDTYMLYDKWKTGSIAVPAELLPVSQALSELVKASASIHFSKDKLSAANLGFDKRREEDSKLMDDFIAWMVDKGLAISGGDRKPFRLTEQGQEFY